MKTRFSDLLSSLDVMTLPQNAAMFLEQHLVKIAKLYQEQLLELHMRLTKEVPSLVERTQFTQIIYLYQSLPSMTQARIVVHPSFSHWFERVNDLMQIPDKGDSERKIEESLASAARFVIIFYLFQHPQAQLNCFLRVNQLGQLRFPEHPFYLDFGMEFANQTLELVSRDHCLNFLRNGETILKLPVECLLQGSASGKITGQPDKLPRLAIQELKPDPTMFPIVLSDINAFTGEDFLVIQEKTLKYVALTREEWLQKNPTTWEEKTAFYEQTQSYIYELAEWHRRDPVNKRILSARAEGTTLDYGCGTATLSLLGHIEGKLIHAYDIPSVTFQFAKFRLRRHGLEHLICVAPKPEAYDTVICVDVLEHIQNPERMLKDLKGLLKPGGLLIANAAGFPELEHSHPMHEFLNNDDVERMVKQLGFTDIDRYYFNVIARK